MPPRYDLATLMSDADPVALRAAFDWGVDLGREVADDDAPQSPCAPILTQTAAPPR